MNRRLRALERRLGDKDFKSGAPPVDADGMPCWGGSEPLFPDGYTRALGDLPDEDLTDEELETRARLSPYLALFKRLERDEKAGVGT